MQQSPMNGSTSAGAAYVQTNAVPNEVIAFRRSGDGSLDRIGSVATGSDGTASPHLTSQGSVALTRDGRHLLVTNAATDDLSVFSVVSDGSIELHHLDLAEDLMLALDRVSFAKGLAIEPDSWQEDLLRSASNRVLLNCCRQSGKSTITAIVALHRALYHPGSLILCLAPALRQSQELFSKMALFYRNLGKPISAVGERKLSLELENGSRIVTLPGSEKTTRGFSGTSLLVLDEAARVEDQLYFAVRPMLAVSGGTLMMLSTPYGKRGVFYEEWSDGHGWERYEVPASQCPRISEEFLEEERACLPPFIFRQEYECSFEEIEDQVFSVDLIDRAVTEEVQPLFGTGG
ncbi:MAG: terminase large subunit domain-containing protein [Rubrobacteraceae bacterium]